jgi:predicted porin
VSYERHEDFNPGGAAAAAYAATGGGSDDGFSVVGVWTVMNSLRLSGVYARNEYENLNGLGTSSVKTRGWAVFADWRIAGPHSVKFEYGKARDPKGTVGETAGVFEVGAAGNTGGKVYGLAYAYDLSKRTQAYVAHTQLKNDSGTNNFNQGIAGATLGGKQTFSGVGLRHRF